MPAKLLRLLLLPGAEEDLRSIYEPAFSEIVERLQLLRRFPEMGTPMSPPFHRWRSIVVGIFRVIYRITPRGLEIAWVRHCKRQLREP